MRRRGPRPVAGAVLALADGLAPPTLLARVQRAWKDAVGEAVAEQARPVAERAGTITVSAATAVWAQELDLMAAEIAERLNAGLGGSEVKGLRCVAAPPRDAGRGA